MHSFTAPPLLVYVRAEARIMLGGERFLHLEAPWLSRRKEGTSLLFPLFSHEVAVMRRGHGRFAYWMMAAATAVWICFYHHFRQYSAISDDQILLPKGSHARLCVAAWKD